MKRIAVIPPNDHPVPDILGGAIEGLTTYLIEENERNPKCEFEIFNQSKCIDELKKIHYNHCKIWTTESGIIARYIDKVYLAVRKVLNYKIPYQSTYLKKTIKRINDGSFDLVLIEGNPNYAWRIAKETGLSVILHIHTDHVLDETIHSYQKIIDSTKRIICVSQYIEDQLSRIQGMDKNKLSVCLNCTDQIIFNPESRRKYRYSMRAKLGYEEQDIVFAFIGRVVEMKGVRELVDAFDKCNIKNKKLLIVGGSGFSGSSETDFTKYLREKAAKSEGTIQLTGYVDKSELPKYYAVADVFASPSKYDEAAPLSNIEAMSMGLPCIISNKGGTLEYANDRCITVEVDTNAVENIKLAMEKATYLLSLHEEDFLKDNIDSQWSTSRFYDDMMRLILDRT